MWARIANPRDRELVVREYTVIKPLPTRDGIVGPLQEGDKIILSNANSLKELNQLEDALKNNPIYKGGEHQYEFIENLRGNDWEKYLSIKDVNGTELK